MKLLRIKKYLTGFTLIMVSIFAIGVSKVSARELKIDYSKYEELIKQKGYQSKINDIYDEVMSSYLTSPLFKDNKNYTDIIMFLEKRDNSLKFKIVVYPKDFFEQVKPIMSNYFTKYYVYWEDKFNLIAPSDFQYFGSSLYSKDIDLDTYEIGSFNYTASEMDDVFVTNSFFPGSIDTSDSSSSTSNYYSWPRNGIIYYMNYDLKYQEYKLPLKEREYKWDSIYLDGIKLKDNDEFKTYLSYKEEFTFDEIISASRYSAVEFIFDTPLSSAQCNIAPPMEQPEYIECPLLELDYSFRSTDEVGKPYFDSFGIPYLEKKYLFDTGTSSVNKTDTIPLSDITTYEYIGTKVLDSQLVEGLKLVVPLDYLLYGFVHLSFESSRSFTVNYIEKDNSHMSSIDITGKAGVKFLPKQIVEDSVLGFGFHSEASYGLQLRDTYKENYKILKYYTVGYCDSDPKLDTDVYFCPTGYQVYSNFVKGNLEQIFIVYNQSYVNDSYDYKSIVYYDNRYFVPSVCDTIFACEPITHPVTGEEINPGGLDDFYDEIHKDKNDSFFQLFVSSFNHFKSTIKEIFDNISLFFNGLPIDLKYFFMIIFGLGLFGFIVMIIL